MADAVAPQGEATPSNTNPEPQANVPTEAPQAPATPPAEGTPEPIFSQEEAEKIKHFLDNHGGLEKVKQTVTARKADMKPAEPASEASAPADQSASMQPQADPNQAGMTVTPQNAPKGFLTPYEIMSKTYNSQLENDPKYEAIKDYVHNGEYMTEMKKMGMTPVDANGNFNDAVIRQWLDIKAQTVPAPATAAPVTTTPIADYREYEGGVDSYEKAMDVYRQGSAHPQFADAQKVINEHFNGKKPVAK